MACYDRRILVPYLRDVCSTELLCSYLQKEVEKCEYNITKFNQLISWAQKIEDPQSPRASERTGYSFLAALYLCILLFGLLISIAFQIIGFCIILFGGIGITAILFDEIKRNRMLQEKYEEKVKRYKCICRNNRTERNRIPQYQTALETKQAELRALSEQLREAQKLRGAVYDVNIIPLKYRNLHVAYFLYDYINSCYENDLDKIIQTLLLDEISQKPDEMIAQNEEMLLNQRHQIAVQELQDPSETEQHRGELQQLAELEQNQELQGIYQTMIAKNKQVTDFFLAADYIPF
ncbi:MAG: hypothetical protein KBT45_03310 [Bacteroidales bacterium]|nr:hypothetical protein [Candidatus Colimorpha pelethequi]